MSEDNIRQSKWDDRFQNMEAMLTSAISKAGKAAKEEDKFTDAIDRNTKATERNNKAKRESAKITPKRSQLNDYWSNSKEEGRGWIQEALKNYKNSEDSSRAQKENARELVKIMNAFRAQWQSVEGFTKETLKTYQDLQNSVDAQGRRTYSNKSGFGFDVRTFADAFREAGLYKANGLSLMNEADVNKRIGDIELEINDMLKSKTLKREYNSSTNEAKQLLNYLKENWNKTQDEAKQKKVDFNRENFPELFEKRDLLNQKYSTFSGKDKDLHHVNTLLGEYRELTNYVAKSASDIPKYIQELNNYFNPNDYKRQVNAGKRNAQSIIDPHERDDRLSATDLARGTSSSSDGMSHFKEETQEAESMVDNLGRKIDKTFGKRLSGTKLVNDLGQVIALVHSSNEEFEEFDLNKSRFGKMGYGAYMALDDSYANKHQNKTTSEWYANITGRIIDSDKDRLTDDDANAIMERFMPNIDDDYKEKFVKRLTAPFNQAKDVIKEIAEKAGVEYKDVLAHIDIDAIYKNLSGNKEILILDPSKLVKANQAIIEQGNALQRIKEIRESANFSNDIKYIGNAQRKNETSDISRLLEYWNNNPSDTERGAYVHSSTGSSSISVLGTDSRHLSSDDLQKSLDYANQLGIMVDTLLHTHPESTIASLQRSDIEAALDNLENGINFVASLAGDEITELDIGALIANGMTREGFDELFERAFSNFGGIEHTLVTKMASQVGYNEIDSNINLSDVISTTLYDQIIGEDIDKNIIDNDIFNEIVQAVKDNILANIESGSVYNDTEGLFNETLQNGISNYLSVMLKNAKTGEWITNTFSENLSDKLFPRSIFERKKEEINNDVDMMQYFQRTALANALDDMGYWSSDYLKTFSRNEYLSKSGNKPIFENRPDRDYSRFELDNDKRQLHTTNSDEDFLQKSIAAKKEAEAAEATASANEKAANAAERRADATERTAKAEKEAESSSAQENDAVKEAAATEETAQTEERRGEATKKTSESSAEKIEETTDAIEKEGNAAEKATPKKDAFKKANKEVGDESDDAQDKVGNVTKQIKDEEKAASDAAKESEELADKIKKIEQGKIIGRTDFANGDYRQTFEDANGRRSTISYTAKMDENGDTVLDDEGLPIIEKKLVNINTLYEQYERKAVKTIREIIQLERALEKEIDKTNGKETDRIKFYRARLDYLKEIYNRQAESSYKLSQENPDYKHDTFIDATLEATKDETSKINIKESQSADVLIRQERQRQKELEKTDSILNDMEDKVKRIKASISESSRRPITDPGHLADLERQLKDINDLISMIKGNRRNGTPISNDENLFFKDMMTDLKLSIDAYKNVENPVKHTFSGENIRTSIVQLRENIKGLIADSKKYGSATEDTTKALEKQLQILAYIGNMKWDDTIGGFVRAKATIDDQSKTLERVRTSVKRLKAEYDNEKKAARDSERDIIALLRQRARALQDISKYDVNTAEYTNAVNSFVEANNALSGIDLTKMSRSVKTAFDTTQRQTEKQISTIRSQLIAARDLYQEYFGSDLFGETAQENLDVLSALFGGDIENIDLGKMFATDPEEMVQKLRTVLAAYDEFVSKIRNTKDVKSLSLDIKLLSDAFYEMDNAGSRFPGLARRIGDLEDEIQELASSAQPSEEQIRKLKEEVAALRKELEKYKKANAASSFEELGQSISKLFKSTLGRFVQIERVVSYMRRMYTSIKEVDSALTELRKVSDVSNDRLQASFEKSSETAKTLGSVITDVIKQTSDWARLGYSIDEAEDLAYYSTLFQHVGDNMNAEQASEYLISTIHGFGLESKDTIDIINKYNEVANNFAIDTAGIGRSLTKSAASFSAANTDLSQSIALITAANTVIQNPDTVGTMWKTLQARIRSATTELTELGEEQDRFTKSTSKLQKMVKGLTGFDIMEADGKTFKSIYDIILGIGEAWDRLDDIDQAALGEALAGKRNLNALNAVMQNLDVVREAYKAAEESAGSAEREQRNYAKSIQYSADVFKTTLQDLELQFINAQQTKALVDLATKLLNIINKIVDTIGPVATAGGLFTVVLGAKHFDKTVQMFKDVGTIIKTLKTGEEGFLGAKGSLAVTKAGLVTFGKYALIIGAVVGAFTLLNKAEEKYGHTAWALGKQIDASNDKLDELSNQAEDTARNIKNLNDKIDELRKKGSLSITDRQDLKNLIAEREELEKIQKENQKDTDEEVKNRAEKQQELFNRKGYADDYTIFNLSSADVGMSESDYEAYRGAYLSKWKNDYQELVKMQSDMLAGGLELSDEYKTLSNIIDEVEKKYYPVERNMKKYNEYLAKFVSTANTLENKKSIINLLDVNSEEAQSLLALDIHDLILEAAKKGKLTMQDLQGIGFYDAFDFSELLGVSDPKNYLLDQIYSEAADQSEEAEIRNTLRALYKNRDFLTTTSSGVNGSPLSEELAKVNNDIAIYEKKLEQYEGVLTRLEKDPSNLNILSNLSTNVKPVTDIMNALNEGVLTEDGMVSLDKRTEALAQFRESIADLDDKIDLGDFDVSGETSKLIDGVMASVTDEDYKKVTQEFWTNLLYNSNALKGVTQDNKQLVKEAFESMGISNADIIVETHLKDSTLQIPVEFVPDKSIAFRNDGTVGGALFNVNKKSAPLTAIQSMYGEAISGDIFDPSKIDLTGLESTLKAAADEAGISWDKFKDNYENFVSTVDSSTSSGEFMGAVNELANAWTEASDILYGVNEDNKEQVISTLTQKGAKNAREYVESQLSDDPIKIPLEMEFDSKALKQDGTIATAVKDFTNKLKPAFDTLGNLYQSIFYKDGKSAFNMKDFGGDQLNEVYDTFVKGATEIGMSFEEATQHYNDFVGVMTKEGVTVDEAHNAINDLISSYVYSSDVLDNLNDETAGVMRTMLKEVGVTNYDEITTKALALAKEHLAGKNLALKASESGLIKSGEDLVNTNWDNVNSLLAEENASDAARAAFVDLVMQQNILANSKLDLEQKIVALSELAAVTLGVGASYKYAAYQQKAFEMKKDAGDPIKAKNGKGKNGKSTSSGTAYAYIPGDESESVTGPEVDPGFKFDSEKQILDELVNLVKTTVSELYKGATGNTRFNLNPQDQEKEKTGDKENHNRFENIIDWVEIGIKRLQRTAEDFGKTANNTYETWSERGTALRKELETTRQTAIAISRSKQTYDKKAAQIQSDFTFEKVKKDLMLDASEDSPISKLTEDTFNSVAKDWNSYIELIQTGRWSGKLADLEEFKGDSNTAKGAVLQRMYEKLIEYQEYWEKSLDAEDQLNDNIISQGDLYVQALEMWATAYEQKLTKIETYSSYVDEQLSQSEARGYVASEAFYRRQLKYNAAERKTLQSEYAQISATLEHAVIGDETSKGEKGIKTNGGIEMTSEEYEKQQQKLREIRKQLEENETAELELNNSIRDVKWQVFDMIIDRMEKLTSETEFLAQIFDENQLYVKKYDEGAGQFTDEGMAVAGTHAINYNVKMRESQYLATEAAKIKKELEDDQWNQDLQNRYDDLIAKQREAILAAEAEKDAIRDMVSNGIDIEMEHIQWLVDEYEKALDAQKNLYDYSKNLRKQTKAVSDLQKQLSAYQGDTSEENRQRLQQLNNNLKDQQEALQEMQYDRFMSDQKDLLSDLVADYEVVLKRRLEDTDRLMKEIIVDVNDNAQLIATTLESKAESLGASISPELNNIFTSAIETNKHLTDYFDPTGGSFTSKLNSVNEELTNIYRYLHDEMVTALQKDAKEQMSAFGDTLKGVAGGELSDPGDNSIVLQGIVSRFNDAVQLATDKSIEENQYIKGKKWKEANMSRHYAYTSYKDAEGIIDEAKKNGGSETLVAWMNDQLQGIKQYYTSLEDLKAIQSGKKKLPSSGGTGGNGGDGGSGGGSGGDGTGENGGQGQGDKKTLHKIKSAAQNQEVWVAKDTHILSKSGADNGMQYFRNSSAYTKDGYVRYTVLGTSGNLVHVGIGDGSSGYTGTFELGKLWAYAKGTSHISSDRMAWTQEKGLEAIIRPTDGAVLTPLKKNDAVLNAGATANMFDFANNPLQFMRGLMGANVGKTIVNSGTTNNDINMSITLPNVTNYEQFKYALQHDKQFENMVQTMTLGRMMGKSSIAKYSA